ncbi:hypothetical protein [Mesorhizobium neociceri]|uniref:Uncharacterized protein n=1 Tax=Mesorhizobium neociceri TaxID=1307853 RepID=A0A838B376_9HYPH|nr:hypothetical protein [Mesorhizobium neociceri]MBA1140244.1 hypothetical protein [Mesorhizobium neociceri]
MDVHKILSDKIERLPIGDHTEGIKAVLFHIGTAVRHLQRGQAESDESYFTDAIYRCNQAFEGSIKEAYRVLAAENPEKKTPAEIEIFLQNGKLLKKRVLDLFSNYRREWRNPSTHDYKLLFHEDESLLAIVSVTVFAIVLCDQILTKLTFESSRADVVESSVPEEIKGDLLSFVAEKIRAFASNYVVKPDDVTTLSSSYAEIEGAIGGFLSAEFAKISGLSILLSPVLDDRYEADLLVSLGGEHIALEIRSLHGRVPISSIYELSTSKVRSLLQKNRKVTGVVMLFYNAQEADYIIGGGSATGFGANVRVVMARESFKELERLYPPKKS